jgi:glycosyltransferase involved in cell wall biosynthesis
MTGVLHVVTTLDVGGAQMSLPKLLQRTDRERFPSRVVALTDAGALAPDIEELGVPVHALGMRRGISDPRAVVRLARLIRRQRPDVVQTWMYHSDLLGGLAACACGGPPVAWGIRQSDLDSETSPRLTRWSAAACPRLSPHVPARIVCCSQASLGVHAALGYATQKMTVIRTGFDLDVFRPDVEAREALRSELRIDQHAQVVGLVGRFDPQKDLRTFFSAAGVLTQRVPDVRFVLCGEGITEDNRELAAWAG